MAEDFSKYQGQKVIVQVKLDTPNDNGETLVEIEGKAEAANALGILLKPKGRTQVELIEADKIEGVEFAPEKERKLTAKPLLIVKYGQARNHLLERHGMTLTEANAISEEDALSQHDDFDHESADLGHVHKEKESKDETPRAKAIAEAETTEGENVA